MTHVLTKSKLTKLFTIKKSVLVHRTTGRKVGHMYGARYMIMIDGYRYPYDDIYERVERALYGEKTSMAPINTDKCHVRNHTPHRIYATDGHPNSPIHGAVWTGRYWQPTVWAINGEHEQPEYSLEED